MMTREMTDAERNESFTANANHHGVSLVFLYPVQP